jgi:TetR/AcrR family transcriptional regulator, repressor for neighboring sulfatase
VSRKPKSLVERLLTPHRPRTRRDPAEARARILTAAGKLLAERGPDAIGLKDVARACGVSHALVSHYFGKWERLVEEALREQAMRVQRELLAHVTSDPNATPEDWIEHFFEAIGDTLYGRLAVWALISGRADRPEFFMHHDRGMRDMVDALLARANLGIGPQLDRAEYEFAVLLTVSCAFGYLAGSRFMWESLGHAPSPERDRAFRKRYAQLLLDGLRARGI